MKIVLKDKIIDEGQRHLVEELVVKYKDYLNSIDEVVFKSHGVRLLQPQLAYVALSLEQTLHKNSDKSNAKLMILMVVAATKAVCEMLCLEIPDEVEIDDKTLKIIRS